MTVPDVSTLILGAIRDAGPWGRTASELAAILGIRVEKVRDILTDLGTGRARSIRRRETTRKDTLGGKPSPVWICVGEGKPPRVESSPREIRIELEQARADCAKLRAERDAIRSTLVDLVEGVENEIENGSPSPMLSARYHAAKGALDGRD